MCYTELYIVIYTLYVDKEHLWVFIVAHTSIDEIEEHRTEKDVDFLYFLIHLCTYENVRLQFPVKVELLSASLYHGQCTFWRQTFRAHAREDSLY